jgi:hypothetical protein
MIEDNFHGLTIFSVSLHYGLSAVVIRYRTVDY